jgi:ElaB/YqjD/DUF883 family membrane-anchored ribosome-binding protein
MAEDTPKPAAPIKKAPTKTAPKAKPATAAPATKQPAAAKPATAKPAAKPKASAKDAFADVTGAATQTLKEGAAKMTKEATGKARAYAEDGKARVGGVLDELSKMMGDAAGTVDEKVGAQYGNYARRAADAESLKSKNVDDIVADARDFVKKSPAIAIGTAAAIGFVLVRLIKSGLDSDDRA